MAATPRVVSGLNSVGHLLERVGWPLPAHTKTLNELAAAMGSRADGGIIHRCTSTTRAAVVALCDGDCMLAVNEDYTGECGAVWVEIGPPLQRQQVPVRSFDQLLAIVRIHRRLQRGSDK